MGPRWQKTALIAPPLVAVAVVALGLRLAASGSVDAAVVVGAPPAGAREGLAWPVVVKREEQGVAEPRAAHAIAVHARRRDGSEALWEGATDEQGVAEAWLPLAGIAPGEVLALAVRSAGDTRARPLAEGDVTVPPAWTAELARADAAPAFLPPALREGAIALDVTIPGGALVTEFPTRVLVRATDRASGAPKAGVHLRFEPEPGLETASPLAVTCTNGWAEMVATARAHVVGSAIHARASDGTGGEWFGAWPARGGAFAVPVPSSVDARAPLETYVAGPRQRRHAYVEVNDTHGRARAASVPLRATDVALGGGDARSEPLTLPGMLPGVAWVIAASEPRAAETLSGATLATPFLVAEPGLPHLVPDTCARWPALAAAAATGFPRTAVLDGFAPRRAELARTRRRGVGLALFALALAAALETLLLVRFARRARAAIEDAEEAFREGGARFVEGRAGTVLVGLGVALLGFALLAALLLSS